MDYEKLLFKYINHVEKCEGTTFLWAEILDEFTEEEIAALRRLYTEGVS